MCVCGGRGGRDGPSCGVLWLMALGTDGRPLILVRGPASDKCALQSQMELKMEVCMRAQCLVFSVGDQLCNVATD